MLSGCNNKRLADLEQYVQQIKSRSQGTIEPLPAVRPYKTFTYQASGLRDPFIPTVVGLPLESIAPTSSELKNTIAPDLNRHKEALEEYALDSLKMVGILKQGAEIWGIVRAPDGILYRIKKGNHMGRNYGKITSINEETIEVTEIVPDEGGGWSRRQTTLALAE
jgi:type IV pilus assembly protein PilP